MGFDFSDNFGLTNGKYIGKITKLEYADDFKYIEVSVFTTCGPEEGKNFKSRVYFGNIIGQFFEALGEDIKLPNGAPNKDYTPPPANNFLAEEVGFTVATAPDKRNPEKSYCNYTRFFDALLFDSDGEADQDDPFEEVELEVAPPTRRRR
jgi:hypothetical protein